MIDITQPIFIYDDRGKEPDDITIDNIMFQTGDFILCKAEAVDELLLINIKTERVLNAEYWSWYATNQPKGDRKW